MIYKLIISSLAEKHLVRVYAILNSSPDQLLGTFTRMNKSNSRRAYVVQQQPFKKPANESANDMNSTLLALIALNC